MTEERNSVGMDPTELWSQWYEKSSKMWSDIMSGATGAMGEGRESTMDPYGLYRQWFSGMEQMRDRMMSAPGMMPQAGVMPQAGMSGMGSEASQNLWNKLLEASAEGLQKTAQVGTEMVDMTPRWVQAMEQARDNLMAAKNPARDPLEFAVQWYNATSGPVSEFVQELTEREEFLEPSSRFLQSYASLYKVFKRNSEEYLSSLQLPVRSDITRVASLIVALEDKVDRIEEAFEDFEYGYAKPATAESVGTLETSVGTLESSVGALEKSVGALDRRMDKVESKLDQLLTAIEGLSSNGSATTNGSEGSAASAESVEETPQEEIKATDAAQRKAQELGISISEVTGTGADGQVTVGDVREKGTS